MPVPESNWLVSLSLPSGGLFGVSRSWVLGLQVGLGFWGVALLVLVLVLQVLVLSVSLSA